MEKHDAMRSMPRGRLKRFLAVEPEELLRPQDSTLKERVRFYFDDLDSAAGRAVDIFIISLILLTSAIFVLETYPLPDETRTVLRRIDAAVIFVFVVEYLLRLWVAERRFRYMFSRYAIIDLLAILPFFLVFFRFEFLRVLRVFRFLRLIRFYESHGIIARSVGEDVFVVFRLFFTLFSILFVFSGFIYNFEHPAQPEVFATFFDAFYYSVITLATVGFGDLSPVTFAGRITTIIMLMVGFVFIPWQLTEFVRHIVTKRAR